MKKASTLKIAGKLRELTAYAAVRENVTRWSSTYQMISRFLKIHTQLSGVMELLSLLPNHLEVDHLIRAHESLKKFNSVTIMLQRDGMSFVESREIFDLFLTDYPDFANYLADDALIVENQPFEKALMQIAHGQQISEVEEALVAPFLKDDSEDQKPEEVIDEGASNDDGGAAGSEPYSEALQRKLKRQRTQLHFEKPKVYINLDVLPGTSVNCERLFSTAKFILSDTRKRTSPTLFEALLLLKVNRSFWNVFMVGKAMGSISEAAGDGGIDEDDSKLDMDSDCNA
jgi:hypothetical protein